MTSFVYFLRPVGAEGPVKIGCSVAPLERLYAYMPWSPEPLELAARIRGNYTLEARFHNRFIADRTHHEWFRASAELSATISAIKAGTFDVDTLPHGPRKGWGGVKAPWTFEARLSASMGRRMDKLSRKGVEIPSAVTEARYRYGAGRYSPYHNAAQPYDPADARTVCDFLAKHGETPPLAA